jgi:DNA polymerase III delta subunit
LTDFNTFQRQVAAGQVPPLALLHGPDVQALDDALAAVTRALFADPALAALGREVLDARDTPAEAVALTADTLPLGVTTRLVAVRHCEAWLVKGIEPKGTEPLREYLKRPSPSTCLLLLAGEPLSANRERKADHWLLNAVPAAAIVTLVARTGRGLSEWLRQRAASEGYAVTEDAARLLIEWIGEEPVTLLAELRKAALAGGPDNVKVGEQEVKAVVGEHRVNEVWDLTRALERGDRPGAVMTLEQLLASEEPMRILTLLTGALRRAWRVHERSRLGQAPDQIARMERIPPHVVQALVARTRGAAGERLPRQLERCWEVERRLKSSGEPRAELTALVAELCAGG